MTNEQLLEDAARKLQAFRAAHGSPERGKLIAVYNQAAQAYFDSLIKAGTPLLEAQRQARREIALRAFELWHAENGSPKEICLKITRSRVRIGSGRYAVAERSDYATVGPDGTEFSNTSLRELRLVIKRAYPGVRVMFEQDW